jgi:membrane fusion protein
MHADESPPFLEPEPPIWAARGLAWILLALFVAALAGSILMRVPETVRGRFVLAPVGGMDPVRSMRDGVVSEVRAVEGSVVADGSALFVIRSPGVGDRSAELATLGTRIDGTKASIENARRQHESERQSDEAEVTRLASRVDYLTGLVPLKREQLALARRLEAGYGNVRSGRAVSEAEYARVALDAHRLAEEVSSTEREIVDTRAALEKHRLAMATRAARFAEELRALGAARDEAVIRATALENDVGRGDGGSLAVRAPCAGTVVRLRVNAAGAVVQTGDVLGEVACSGQRLRAEMVVPPEGLALMEPGQGVKLLYDAFPYQRYGVRAGVVRWLGPMSARGDSSSFRAFIEIDTSAMRVVGQRRPFVVGMGGRADVVVARRSLISYAFEPIRRLRESVADVPPRT